MPFLYNNLQGYIERPLGQYTVRRDSYTGTLTTEKKVTALKGQEKSVLFTLRQINAEKKYYRLFIARIRRDRFYTALHGKDRRTAEECWQEYRRVKKPTKKDILAWALYCMGLYRTVWTIKKRKKRLNKPG